MHGEGTNAHRYPTHAAGHLRPASNEFNDHDRPRQKRTLKHRCTERIPKS
jgi:hypothetical protein